MSIESIKPAQVLVSDYLSLRLDNNTIFFRRGAQDIRDDAIIIIKTCIKEVVEIANVRFHNIEIIDIAFNTGNNGQKCLISYQAEDQIHKFDLSENAQLEELYPNRIKRMRRKLFNACFPLFETLTSITPPVERTHSPRPQEAPHPSLFRRCFSAIANFFKLVNDSPAANRETTPLLPLPLLPHKEVVAEIPPPPSPPTTIQKLTMLSDLYAIVRNFASIFLGIPSAATYIATGILRLFQAPPYIFNPYIPDAIADCKSAKERKDLKSFICAVGDRAGGNLTRIEGIVWVMLGVMGLACGILLLIHGVDISPFLSIKTVTEFILFNGVFVCSYAIFFTTNLLKWLEARALRKAMNKILTDPYLSEETKNSQILCLLQHKLELSAYEKRRLAIQLKNKLGLSRKAFKREFKKPDSDFSQMLYEAIKNREINKKKQLIRQLGEPMVNVLEGLKDKDIAKIDPQVKAKLVEEILKANDKKLNFYTNCMGIIVILGLLGTVVSNLPGGFIADPIIFMIVNALFFHLAANAYSEKYRKKEKGFFKVDYQPSEELKNAMANL